MRKAASFLAWVLLATGVILIVALTFVKPIATRASEPDCPNDPASQVYLLVNQYRIAHGVRPLIRDPLLDKAAQDYAQMMRDEGFYSHTSPDGSTVASRINAVLSTLGYPIVIRAEGENLAAGQTNAQAAMDAWKGSPGHNANMLNAAFTQVGTGYAAGGQYGYYWVQDFTRYSAATDPDPLTLPPPTNINPCPSGTSATPLPTPVPTVTPTPIPPAKVTLTKTVEKTQAVSGDILTYYLEFHNTSTTPATNVVLKDIVPTGTTYVANSANPSANVTYNSITHELRWNVGIFAGGANITYIFKTKVN